MVNTLLVKPERVIAEYLYNGYEEPFAEDAALEIINRLTANGYSIVPTVTNDLRGYD